MGLFQQRPEEQQNEWAGLPSEPLHTDAADTLDAAPAVDPFTLGLGNPVTSIVFPVAPPAPEAESFENGEPKGEPDDSEGTD